MIDITQTDNASNNNKNNNNDKHPLPSDEESDWYENLYPHSYQAKVQSQVPPRQPPPGWASWRKKESLPTSTTGNITQHENKNDKDQDIEVYYE